MARGHRKLLSPTVHPHLDLIDRSCPQECSSFPRDAVFPCKVHATEFMQSSKPADILLWLLFSCWPSTATLFSPPSPISQFRSTLLSSRQEKRFFFYSWSSFFGSLGLFLTNNPLTPFVEVGAENWSLQGVKTSWSCVTNTHNSQPSGGWCIARAISVAKQDSSTLDKHLQLSKIYWDFLGEHLHFFCWNIHATWNQELLWSSFSPCAQLFLKVKHLCVLYF